MQSRSERVSPLSFSSVDRGGNGRTGHGQKDTLTLTPLQHRGGTFTVVLISISVMVSSASYIHLVLCTGFRGEYTSDSLC